MPPHYELEARRCAESRSDRKDGGETGFRARQRESSFQTRPLGSGTRAHRVADDMVDAASFPGPAGIFTWFALVLLAGRIVTAWMPPGRIGGHALRDLPATAGTSFLVGVVVWSVGAALPVVARIVLAALLVVLAAVRIATVPAAMVPRHEPPLVRESWLSRAIAAAAWIVIAWAVRAFALREGADPLDVAAFGGCVIAVGVLVADALEVARCPAWVRSTGVLVYASMQIVEPAPLGRVPGSCAPFFFAAAMLSAISWFRRADRRALALAVVFAGGAGLVAPGGWILMGAAALWLVIGTPSASRVLAAGWCAIAIGLVAAMKALGLVSMEPEAQWAWTPSLSSVVPILFVMIVVARWLDMREMRARTWNPSGAPIGHEDVILLRAVLTVLLGSMMVGMFAPQWPSCDPFRPALMVLAVLAGLALRRFAPKSGARIVS
jgi:hypothetical protein